MQQMKMKVVLLALVTTLVAPIAAYAACDRLFVAPNQLRIETVGNDPVVLSDPDGVVMPRWSPDGDRIAYTRRFRFDRATPSALVMIDRTGRTIRALAIPAESAVNAVLQLGWRDDQHVFIEGHVNPSTSQYLEWDVTTGQLLAEKPGSWFAVSPDGRFIAQHANVPHGAPPPYDSATLLINDEVAYPLAGDEAYRHFIGALAWAPDSSQVALLDGTDDTADLVLVTPESKHVARTRLTGIYAPEHVSWSGTNTLLIRTSSGETWQTDTAGQRPTKVLSPRVRAEKAVVSIERGVSAHIADERCTQ